MLYLRWRGARSQIALTSLIVLILISGCGPFRIGDPAPLVTFEVHNSTSSLLELRQWRIFDGHLARDAGTQTDRKGKTVWRTLNPGTVTDVLVQADVVLKQGDGARLEAFDGTERLFCEVYDLSGANPGSRYRVEIEAGHIRC
jgi:hypothetical protein